MSRLAAMAVWVLVSVPALAETEAPPMDGTSWALLPEIKLEGDRIETARHLFTLDPSGLPAQIEIKPDPRELPLANRGPRAKAPTTDTLRTIGRGPQLRAPLRLSVSVKGKTQVAKVVEPARPAAVEGKVGCVAKLAAGPLTMALKLSYERDGAIFGQLSYEGKRAKVGNMALVAELEGLVDLVIPGTPVTGRLRAYPAEEFALSPEEGLIWGNSVDDAKGRGRALPGVVPHLFVGSGDRGLTWLSDPGPGWNVDKKVSTMSLERDQEGHVTWQVRFINRGVTVSGQKTVSFALLTHPATFKPAGFRRQCWTQWPTEQGVAKALPLTLRGRRSVSRESMNCHQAGSATVFEPFSGHCLIAGAAGGDALAAARNHAETWPIGLFKYLAGTHTGLATRLRSNSASLIRAGMSRAADRVLLGRALLHDIGLDASRLAHLNDAVRVVKALREFGALEPDQMTEFIPYWRTSGIVRFGEIFSKDDPFQLGKENPLARVYVSVYLRLGNRNRGRKALIVIANESDRDVRDQLYVLDPGRLFGGQNRLERKSVIGKYDFTALVETSDWGKPGLLSRAAYRSRAVLEDAEDHGVVGRPAAKRGLETYGPMIHVPAYSFRILYGTGSP